jgi:transposase
MMGRDESKQAQFMFICLDDYVPEDHLLRKILKVVDFSFIYEQVKDLYAPVGRRSIDSVLLVKMLLVGYLYGIPSERKLEQEVKLNLAYRWFLGLDLADQVPDHSTLSQNRRRRFKSSGLFQQLFNAVVTECIRKGIVSGELIVTDTTHIKAHAAKDKQQIVRVEQKPSEYLQELERSSRQLEQEQQEKRERQGKKKPGKKPDRKSVV